MTSGDERDAYIRRLRGEGWSAIEIAAEVGLSRSQVHRILATAPAVDDAEGDEDSDLDDRDIALLNAEDSGHAALAPFRFVGMESVVLEIPGCDAEEPVEVERFLDGNGAVGVDVGHLPGGLRGRSEGHGYLEDCCRLGDSAVLAFGFQLHNGLHGVDEFIALVDAGVIAHCCFLPFVGYAKRGPGALSSIAALRRRRSATSACGPSTTVWPVTLRATIWSIPTDYPRVTMIGCRCGWRDTER